MEAVKLRVQVPDGHALHLDVPVPKTVASGAAEVTVIVEPEPRGAHSGAAVPLSQCLESVDSPEGRLRVAEHLEGQPFPHYEPAPGRPGMLVRIEADGTRTLGHFVDRQFRAAD